MKRIILFIAVCLLPFAAFCQKIEYSKVEEFTGKPIIQSSWTSLSAKAIFPSDQTFNMEFMILSESGNLYLV